MKRLARGCGALLLLALAGLPGCDRAGRPAGIILITLDTTRADRLGSYGNRNGLPPNLDAFAKEAVRFDQAIAAVPTTLPSHATMFTGFDPPVHGVRYNGMFKLGDESVTIAEMLRGAGFATGAVPSAYPVWAKSGLAQGFDTYLDMFSGPDAAKHKMTSSRNAEDVTRLGLEWIRSSRKHPFFVWLHYYDAHYPYEPPFPFSVKYREHPYDGEIAYVDAQLGVLFAALRSEKLWDDVAIVIAGDHGEGLYEHGERMHSQLAYESTLRVPFLVKASGAKRGAAIGEAVTLADVAPTILDIARLKIPAGLDGISLAPAMQGQPLSRRALYFETLAGSLSYGWSPIEGLRRGKWKLIRSSEPELFDLDADPGELNNLYSSEGQVVADLDAALSERLAEWAKTSSPAQASEVPVDPDAVARLASLGYVGGSMTATRAGGPAPKKMEHLQSELLLIQDLTQQRRYADVLAAAGHVLEEDPGNSAVLLDAAGSAGALHQFADAERYARELLRRYPESVPGTVTLGRILVAQKRYADAEKEFRDGLARSHDEPILAYSLALTLLAEGRTAEARPLAEKALEKKGADPAFHVIVAVCKAAAADPSGAKTDLEAAIGGGYDQFDTLRNEPLFAPLRTIPGFNQVLDVRKAS